MSVSTAETSTGLPMMMKSSEVATALRLSLWTVQRLCMTGQLDGAVKVRDRWLVPASTITALLGGE